MKSTATAAADVDVVAVELSPTPTKVVSNNSITLQCNNIYKITSNCTLALCCCKFYSATCVLLVFVVWVVEQSLIFLQVANPFTKGNATEALV